MSKKKLSDLQIEALDSLYDSFNNNVNPICAAGTGSGKTRIACELIQSIINDNNSNYRILIIHKASNHEDPWLQELTDYKLIKNPRSKPRDGVLTPKGLTPLINEIDQSADTRSRYIYIHGKDRDKYLNKEKYHFPKKVILFTSYETLRLDIDHNYYDLTNKFDLIIFDELHTIINYKRLTKKSINIYLIQAKKKLALTASPMNNHENELGIQYAFLNDSAGFSELIKLYSLQDNEKEKMNVELESKLIAYNKLCVKNNFIFYCNEKKSGFQKNAVIISLPIDGRMLFMVNEMPFSRIAKQKFLSHPSALIKNEDISTLPYCTKEHAVRIILQSMLNNEKAVIFSLYIDVLNVYADICRNIGLPAMIITGNDKGEKLKQKLIEFKNSATIRVLLTTLQKSAEGFNFDYATHVIILEFWWNPQKILQAMSRIDRKKQKRNIFIYILCYNNEGTMIKQEKCFYDKMVKKLNKANSIFQKIEQIHPKKNPDLQPFVNTDIPKIQPFVNTDTFENELRAYIEQFQHTQKDEETTNEFVGFPILVTRDMMINDGNYILQYKCILENAPWRIETKEVKSFLNTYYNSITSTDQDILVNKKIEEDIRNYKMRPNLNTYYHTIFVKHFNFKVRMDKGSLKKLPLLFLIGKMDNGKYALLGIYYITEPNFCSIFNDLTIRGVKKIKIILSYMNNREIIQDALPNFFPNAVCQCCLTNSIESASRKAPIYPEELDYIDHIFSANTLNEALGICELAAQDEKSTHKFIFKRLNSVLLFNKELFRYKPKNRNIIGTLNIITYIINYLSILLGEREFINVEEAFTYINYYSDQILQNGKHFIPNWDTLSATIDE